MFSGGNSDPVARNTVQDWTDMYDRLQQRALKTRLKIPILFGVDAVHGHSNVVGATIFPHNIGLGATRNAKLVEEVAPPDGEGGARHRHPVDLRALRGRAARQRWGRTYEGFGEDPALVAELGDAAVRGLQGTNLADPLRVLACAKHCVGDGGTAWGTGTARRPGPSATRSTRAT